MINSLPPAMRAALQSATHAVEFDKLTDDFVISDACRRLQFRHGVLVDPQHPAADSRESFLSETQYHEACCRWLQALQLYHPDDFPIWKRLYNKEWFGSDVPSRPFDQRKEYDILLRATARPVGEGVPAWHYPNLWDRAELIVAKRKSDAMNKKAIALESEIADVRRLAQNLASSSKNASSSTTTAAVPLPNFLEGEPSSKKGGGGQGFRGKGKEKSTFCYVCGSNLHSSFQCTATSKAVGTRGDIFIRRDGADWFIGAGDDRRRFCYAWNLPGGCRIRECNRGQHVCSLCGSSGHGAPSCSA
jgi:hypothetical protein